MCGQRNKRQLFIPVFSLKPAHTHTRHKQHTHFPSVNYSSLKTFPCLVTCTSPAPQPSLLLAINSSLCGKEGNKHHLRRLWLQPERTLPQSAHDPTAPLGEILSHPELSLILNRSHPISLKLIVIKMTSRCANSHDKQQLYYSVLLTLAWRLTSICS